MPHIPSFFVGCMTSGAAFLLVHQELSHRRRLTRKWEIQGTALFESELAAQFPVMITHWNLAATVFQSWWRVNFVR
jgi:hypothetical protein